MEFGISRAGYHNDFEQLFNCNTTKIANYSPAQKPLVKSELFPVCFCCLASDSRLVNAERCTHTDFVKIYFHKEHSSKLWICFLCHHMLVKIEAFRIQVCRSFDGLNSKTNQPNKYKSMNKLSIKTEVSLISIDDDEKPVELGQVDPLFTAEVRVKVEDQESNAGLCEPFGLDEKIVNTFNVSLEPKSDLDSDASMDASISSYFDASKRTDKQKCKPSEASRPKLTMLKKDSSQEAVVKPLRRTSTKNKTKKATKKITKTSKKKVKSKTIKLPKSKTQKDGGLTNIGNTQNLYKGKIQTIELTREELELERERERKKESWEKQNYKCETCLKSFQYSYVLETHNDRHHKMLDSKTMMTCDICKCTLLNSSSYRPHYKRHFTRYVCMVCATRSDDLAKMARHYATCHADRDSTQMEYKCKHCSYTTYTRRSYNYHKRRLHEPKLCTICNKEFTGGISYNFHMKLCHPAGAGGAVRARSFPCGACARVFRSRASCTAHARAAHAPPAPAPYCALCDQHFRHASSYRYHLKTTLVHNNGINNYVCDYCGREFRYKPPLRDHIEIQHLNIWNYKCEPCNKTFSSKNLQMKHIQYVHENKQVPKNKICQFCGKGFASRKTLQCHIRRHTGERPLECEFCGDTFAHDAALYTHRKLKHKVPRKRDTKQTDPGRNLFPRDKHSVGEGQDMFPRDKNSVGEGQDMFPRDKNSVGEGQGMFPRDKNCVGEGQDMFPRDKNSVGD